MPLEEDSLEGEDEEEADKENMAAVASVPAVVHAGKDIVAKEGSEMEEEGEKHGMVLAEQDEEEEEETGMAAGMVVGGGGSQDY
eukprot:evm.model.NODE_1775_length_9066_cov_36.533752.4